MDTFNVTKVSKFMYYNMFYLQHHTMYEFIRNQLSMTRVKETLKSAVANLVTCQVSESDTGNLD